MGVEQERWILGSKTLCVWMVHCVNNRTVSLSPWLLNKEVTEKDLRIFYQCYVAKSSF